MGCCSSKAADPAAAAAATERLEKRRNSHEPGVVVNARVEAEDGELAALGLQLNDELEEGDPLTDEEEALLRDQIVAKLEDPTVMDCFDETSRAPRGETPGIARPWRARTASTPRLEASRRRRGLETSRRRRGLETSRRRRGSATPRLETYQRRRGLETPR